MSTQTRGFNATVTRFFDLAARMYDMRLLQRVMYRPPHDDVILALWSSGARTIVDVGCGTGILTTRIDEELEPDRVYGVDMSAGMLAKAQDRSARVDWRQGPAEALPLADEIADAVVTTTAFHFFDQPAALAEFHRVLRPGGLLAISAINPKARLAKPIQRISGGRLSPAHAASPAQMRSMVEAAGFDVAEQRKVVRPMYSRIVPDVFTVAKRK